MNTGVFNIISVFGDPSGSTGPFTCLTEIRASCIRCKREIHAEVGRGIEAVPGGTILQCHQCGARQGISNARFDEIATRLANASS